MEGEVHNGLVGKKGWKNSHVKRLKMITVYLLKEKRLIEILASLEKVY